MADSIPLRDHLDARLVDLEKRLADQRKADRKQLMTIIRHQAKALRLAAVDYKEHFERLNGEAGRILAAVKVTVSQDTWGAFQKELHELKELVKVELASRTLARAIVYGSIVLAVATAGVVLTYIVRA